MSQIPIKNGFSSGPISEILRTIYNSVSIGTDIYYADCPLPLSNTLFVEEGDLVLPDIDCNKLFRVFTSTLTRANFGTYYTGAVYNGISTPLFLRKSPLSEDVSRLESIDTETWAKQDSYYTGTAMKFAKGQFCGENFIDITSPPPRFPVNIGDNIISVVVAEINGTKKYLNLNSLYGLSWSIPEQLVSESVSNEYSFNNYSDAYSYYSTHTASSPEALYTYIQIYKNHQSNSKPFICTTMPFSGVQFADENIIIPYNTNVIYSSNTKIPVDKPEEITEDNVGDLYIFPSVGGMSGRTYEPGFRFYFDSYSRISNCIYANTSGDKFDELIIMSDKIEDSDYVIINSVESNSPYLPGGDYGSQSVPSNAIGSFDGTAGPSMVGNLPDGAFGADIASSGMYTKYLCNGALLSTLAQFFWEDNIGIQALKAVFGNPIDSIISLTCYPFALDTLVPKTSTTIYFGKYDTTWPAFSLVKSSFKIDWGTVNIPFFWGSFLDYAPYTKIQLYLPWGVGFVSLDPNEVMPWSSKNSFNQTDFTTGSVRVITNIELDKGSCLHNVIGNNGRVIGSFGGIVGKQIPVVGTDDSARTLALIGSAMMIGTSVAGAAASFGGATAGAATAGGFLGATSAIASGAMENIPTSTLLASTSALAKTAPTYPRAGTFSDATSTLGYQYPYLIISRPSQSVPKQYGRFMGYPSNIFHNHLGEVRGYTEVSSIHLENIDATSNELAELESILKGGILL